MTLEFQTEGDEDPSPIPHNISSNRSNVIQLEEYRNKEVKEQQFEKETAQLFEQAEQLKQEEMYILRRFLFFAYSFQYSALEKPDPRISIEMWSDECSVEYYELETDSNYIRRFKYNPQTTGSLMNAFKCIENLIHSYRLSYWELLKQAKLKGAEKSLEIINLMVRQNDLMFAMKKLLKEMGWEEYLQESKKAGHYIYESRIFKPNKH